MSVELPINNYRIARIRKYYELSQDIQRIKATHASNKRSQQDQNQTNDVFSTMISSLLFVNKSEPSQGLKQSETINDYWDIDPLVKKHMNIMQQILIIQKTFRTWIELNNFRKGKKVVSEAVELTVLRQSVVRQWLATTKFINLEINKNANDEKFQLFIKEINDGLSIQMFSKTFGALKRRVLKFDSTFTSLIYKTSKWMPPSVIKISTICDVKKGLSGFKYSQAISAHKAWCFQLHVLGGKVIDLQADDGQQAKELFQGFRKLVLLFFTQAPFYVDTSGIPRRAGPSIIKNALRDVVDSSAAPNQSTNAAPTTTTTSTNANHHSSKEKRTESTVSEADRMRYRNAIRKLKREYGEWNKLAVQEARRQEEEQELLQLHSKEQRNSATTGPRSSSTQRTSQSPDASEITVRQSSFTTKTPPPPPPPATPTLTPTTGEARRLFSNTDGSAIPLSPSITDEIADRRLRSRAETLRKSSIEFVFPGRTRFSMDDPEYDDSRNSKAAAGHTAEGDEDRQDDNDDLEEEKIREKARTQNQSRNGSLRLLLGIDSYKKAESGKPMGRYDEGVVEDGDDSYSSSDDESSDYYSDFSSSDSDDYSN